jgi:hypothetical protein
MIDKQRADKQERKYSLHTIGFFTIKKQKGFNATKV